MARIDIKLKQFIGANFLWLCFICLLLFWLHCYFDAREARREYIYKRARVLAEQEQKQRVRDYQRRAQQRRLSEQYQQGQVVGRQ